MVFNYYAASVAGHDSLSHQELLGFDEWRKFVIDLRMVDTQFSQ